MRLLITALGFTGIAALTAFLLMLALDTNYPELLGVIVFLGWVCSFVWILLILPEALGAKRH